MPLARALGEEKAGQHRRDQHREHQRAQQSERHGPGHRLEQAPFHALQRENRQVGGDDDGDRVEHRPLHLVRGVEDLLFRRSVVLVAAAEVADDVLHHHHRAIHHHSEVQRAQRQQVRGNALQVQTGRGEQQRKRNGQRDDDRAANISEKQKQDNHHQDDAFGQVVQHGVSGVVHQIAAVDERNDFHARGQNGVVQFLHLLVNSLQRRVRVGAFAQQHDA